jgi:hypothetical protein
MYSTPLIHRPMLGYRLPHAENVQYTSDYQYCFPTIKCNNLSSLPWSSALKQPVTLITYRQSYPRACHEGTPDSARTVTRILSLGTIWIGVAKFHTPRCIIPRKSRRFTFKGARLGPQQVCTLIRNRRVLCPCWKLNHETAVSHALACPRYRMIPIVVCNFYTKNMSFLPHVTHSSPSR